MSIVLCFLSLLPPSFPRGACRHGRDPKSAEYRVYHKTWIDSGAGEMFWKRAVMLHTSPDFVDFKQNPGHLCLYPDQYDEDAGGGAYKPGTGSTGIELHAGPVMYHAAADIYLMLAQHLDWTSTPDKGNLNMELALSRGDGTQWERPFRSHLGYPKFLDVNPAPKQFDSGTMWTNAQFVDGPLVSMTQKEIEAVRSRLNPRSPASSGCCPLIPVDPVRCGCICRPLAPTGCFTEPTSSGMRTSRVSKARTQVSTSKNNPQCMAMSLKSTQHAAATMHNRAIIEPKNER